MGGCPGAAGRRPAWLKVRWQMNDNFSELQTMMRDRSLHTVCEEAGCPNRSTCWAQRTATFMILGSICTRACRFCAVATGRPLAVDEQEPQRVAAAVDQMGLRYAVVTSVARDDLADGGAVWFARTVQAIRERNPQTQVEVLIPDFQGCQAALATVLASRPVVLNHNLETVRRLTPRLRAKATYERSLQLLARSKTIAPTIPTKSSLMLGVGETDEELATTLQELRAHSVDILTLGQYLQPSPAHLPIERYVPPVEFAAWRQRGLAMGFAHVEAGPLVRSSYQARGQAAAALARLARTKPGVPIGPGATNDLSL